MIDLLELNKVYKMDNLELLNKLPSNYINLIYCDILYNTGRKFKDYNDNLGTPMQAIEWYRPRIEEMYRVLKDTGSIYLHMDYRLVHYMKVLMDEIFGFDCFRNEIIWSYKRWCGKSEIKLQSMHDNILFYSKGKNKINHLYEEIENPKLYQNRKDKNGDVIRNEDGSVKYFPQYERQIDDVWCIDILNPRAKERTGYNNQKPKSLLERIIKASSNKDEIVLDLFCGSGTTMVVAKELGRKFIGCDISERAIEISEKRLMEVDGKVEGNVSECVS